ncbi:MAG: hypothetical protein HQM15_11985 [Deltaproteobacteria bacterium]|nr:hypothetical protein [Deltaproteobacteria bacterium]
MRTPGSLSCALTSTKDIDVLIPKDLENTEKILHALAQSQLLGMANETLAEDVIQKPFTIIGDQPRVDLLLRAGKLKFEDAYSKREVKEVDGVQFPCVCLADLILSKDTQRPRDQLEIEELKAIQEFLESQKKRT